ncbi:DNA/RNA nuclease SfsA [Clostridium sp. AN503]|uniref:DNA/RNA nuclease SfsA n=1 Tax=Clostridium sp. AN503 TaxID=3160598 RepID=UPI003458A162
MKYDHMMPAVFLERPNRFIAYCDLNGTRVKCHVKNTGRCRELLIPGAPVILKYHPDAAAAGRKTEYSLISVYKAMPHGLELVNMDSQAPNQAAWEWLTQGGLSGATVTKIRREVRFGDSRIDLAFEEDGIPAFMEVKGVTLEQDGVARFPDAPTERGIKHLKELEHAVSEGFHAYAMFVIAMKGVHAFEPNRATHPEFAEALVHAASHGVTILACDCLVTQDSLALDQLIPVFPCGQTETDNEKAVLNGVSRSD